MISNVSRKGRQDGIVVLEECVCWVLEYVFVDVFGCRGVIVCYTCFCVDVVGAFFVDCLFLFVQALFGLVFISGYSIRALP